MGSASLKVYERDPQEHDRRQPEIRYEQATGRAHFLGPVGHASVVMDEAVASVIALQLALNFTVVLDPHG